MICAVGIDSVEISRFSNWHIKSPAILRRIFSDAEIAYCLSTRKCAAERFAVRFAAREAMSKVLHTLVVPYTIPFLRVCRAMSVQKQPTGVPYLVVNWSEIVPETLRCFVQHRIYHLSLTHTKYVATAMIVAE
jgi:holo-[acyl-carrier protein] synthase